MKQLIYVLILLVMVTSIVATDIEIQSVKFYVNDERYSGPDEDGGDIDVNTDDTLEMVIKVQNNLVNKTQVKFRGVLENINDGEDISKEINWFDVEGNDDKSKTLGWVIPSDALYDDYDLELKIYYKNRTGQEHNLEVNYNVYVEKYTEKEEEVDLKDSFDNITSMYNSVVTKYSDLSTNMEKCFNYLNISIQATSELSTCKEQRGKYNVSYNELKSSYDQYKDEIKDKLESKDNEIKDKNLEINKLESTNKVMLTSTQCNNITSTKVAELKKSNNTTIIWLLLIGLAIFGFWKYNKKNKGYLEHGN